MGLSGQVHDRFRPGRRESPPHGLSITDVGPDESEARLPLEVGQRGKITRIRQLIDDRDGMAARDEESGQIRPDEARSAGDQDTHKQLYSISANMAG
jgi:hypothetical protein